MSIQFHEPAVYLITAGDASADNFDLKQKEILSLVEAAVGLGVTMIQIREKRLAAGQLYELVRDAAAITSGSGTRLLVNDRADIAAAAGADGVHLTTVSPPTAKIREFFGDDLLIAVSTHTSEDVSQAKKDGADLVVFGPVFATPGKPETVGLERLTEVCSEHKPFPVLALGGIDAGNYRSTLDAGAAGFAAIRSLNDPRTLAKIMDEIGSI